MESNQQLFRIEASGITQVLKKWWKHILIAGVIAFIAAVIFSGPRFITPLFKSRAIVYASNIAPYATENTTEQLIQIFQSEDVREQVVKDFDLLNHYGVDPAGKFPRNELYGIYGDLVRFSKTPYESAEIIVFDSDPAIASRICDSLISYVNQKIRALHRAKSYEVVKIEKDHLEMKKQEMDSMEAAIKNLRIQYGILEFEEQIKPFSKEYYRGLNAGSSGSGNSRLDRIERNFAEKGGEYVALKEHLWRIRGDYNDIKILYETALINYTKHLSFVNIITRPIPAEKKTYPLRMLIVAGATFSTLFFAFLAALIFERVRRVKN